MEADRAFDWQILIPFPPTMGTIIAMPNGHYELVQRVGYDVDAQTYEAAVDQIILRPEASLDAAVKELKASGWRPVPLDSVKTHLHACIWKPGDATMGGDLESWQRRHDQLYGEGELEDSSDE